MKAKNSAKGGPDEIDHEEIEEIFHHLDADGSGTVTADEAYEAL